MKKLIAQRPVQYGGRRYGRGEALPAQDRRMVAAWLRAGSAVWRDEKAQPVSVSPCGSAPFSVDTFAANALRAAGIPLEDADGNYIGIDALIMRLWEAIAPEAADPPAGDILPAEWIEPADSTDTDGMGTGHLDAEQLAKWKKSDLEKLAADLGVDIADAKNNAERAQRIAAVRVQYPAESPTEVPDHDV